MDLRLSDIEKEERIGSNEMNEDKDYSLSFGESKEQVEKDITNELKKEIDVALYHKDLLDQMTHQLTPTFIDLEEDYLIDEAKNVDVFKEEIKVEKVLTKESRIAEKDFFYLNNALLDLNKKTKDIAVLYISLKQKTEKLERREHELNDVEVELKEIIAHIKSERRYHDLTDVDFSEIIRRVEVKINNKKNKNTKKYFSTKNKNIFLKIFLLISVTALLLTGYTYKTNQVNDTSEDIFKNLLIDIIN
jgi:hypothetical protein